MKCDWCGLIRLVIHVIYGGERMWLCKRCIADHEDG